MVVLSCFINPLDIVKIQDVEKETKEAMCVCGGGGGGCQCPTLQRHKLPNSHNCQCKIDEGEQESS
jgi:hypothetical protein